MGRRRGAWWGGGGGWGGRDTDLTEDLPCFRLIKEPHDNPGILALRFNTEKEAEEENMKKKKEEEGEKTWLQQHDLAVAQQAKVPAVREALISMLH